MSSKTWTQRAYLLGAVSALAVFASGIYLYFLYQPTASAAYNDMETLRSAARLGVWMRRLHWYSSITFVVAMAVVVSCHLQRRAIRLSLVPAVVGLAGCGAFAIGVYLPWNQLALWSLTAGTRLRGFGPAYGGDVRFVLLGGREIAASTLTTLVFVHLAVGLVVIIAALVLSVRHWSQTETEISQAMASPQRRKADV